MGDISDNTGSMAKSLEVSGEELEYLRDIAERDAINRFTTAEVKIDMTGMLNKTAKAFEINGFSGLSLCFTLYFHFIRVPARF